MSGVTRCRRRMGWKLGLASWLVGGAIASSGDFAFAQIVPDGTLPNNSRVTPSGSTSMIEGGTRAGSNLFHSFQQFSVPTGGTAYFNNAADIQNIFGRVTGKSISNIDGLIKANGSANLFLINPNGIIFGPNAQLNIGGSFVASTASSLKFADNTQFSATAHPTTPLLTVSVPIGLQYGGNPASIRNLSQATNSSREIVGLQVQPGKTLALVGGKVNLEGGSLKAPGGRVELGGVSGEGTVGLNFTDNNLSLSFPNDVPRSDISLTNRSNLNVIAGEGGSIAINARNLDISGESSLFAGIGTGLGTNGSRAGNIEINATDKVKIDGLSSTGSSSGVVSIVGPSGIGNGADINIQTGTLSLTNGAQIIAVTFGQGNAGNILVNASDSVTGNGGSVLGASTGGQGNAGNVTIQAGGKVSFDGVGANGSGASSKVGPGAVGNGGNINIQAGSLSLTNGASLSASTGGQGNAGNVTITTDGLVSFDGVGMLNGLPYVSGVIASVIGTGKGGDITIAADSLSVTNGAQLNTLTLGQGNAGNITIKTNGRVSFDGTLVKDRLSFASTVVTAVGARLNSSVTDEQVPVPDKLLGVIPSQGFLATGNGGNIKITAGSLSLTNGAILASTSNFGQGNAGSISVQVNDSVSLAGGGSVIASNVEAGGVGKGGNIDIQSRSFSATGGAVLNTGTRGQGNAGNILVNATDKVELSGVASFPVLKDGTPGGYSSGLLTNSDKGASGQGGEISVTTGTLRVSNGAVLSARSRSAKRGGNITVNANVLEVTSGGQFLTTAYNTGDAGNITVNVKNRITISGNDPTFNERFKQVADAFPNADEVAKFTIDPVSPTSGFFANTAPGSTGNGGSIFINPIKLTITDGAGIAVNSLGKGNAGSLQIQADTLTLDGRSSLSATTASTMGGNINLQVQDLILMRRGSEISTSAGTAQQGGDGGNITINTPNGFIVAVPRENSDITANAFSGNGGNVTINATGIFGTVPRSREDLIRLLGSNDPTQLNPRLLPTSDITAISQTSPNLSGTVTINTPDVDLSRAFVNLPAVPVDTKVAQGCTTGGTQAQSEFIITGRGGLPPNPGEALSTDALQVDLVTLHPVAQPSTPAVSTSPTTSAPPQIVEATGWVIDADGSVVLTANASTPTPHGSMQTPTKCSAPKPSS